MRNASPFLLLIFLCGSVVDGTAQQIAGGNFAKLRQTPVYRKAVISGAFKTAAWTNDICPEAQPSIGTQLTVHAMPIVVNPLLQPQSGAWIEHVTVAGCGRPWQLNVLFQVLVPGSIATVALLPGTTHANPVLQKDGALYAFIAAGVDAKGCKPIYIADTTYVAQSSETPAIPGKPAWLERWSVAQCQQRTEVEMSFTPDRAGTTIKTRRIARPI